VYDDRVLKSLFDGASCLPKNATVCMMKAAWTTAQMITYDTVEPRNLSVCSKTLIKTNGQIAVES
jgi:hypothetical protein